MDILKILYFKSPESWFFKRPIDYKSVLGLQNSKDDSVGNYNIC